ncbi:hypothetical protein EVAR_2621_1 [Eumeta japonica]|uniref:Uncharacterized protein n=1 Tax=Eumeta variegata TaxID=151549 RepID=A0A4C1SPK9_EUMVA|nr:hypothetical protein EVAR_2621_1 [Eumeta japonica]
MTEKTAQLKKSMFSKEMVFSFFILKILNPKSCTPTRRTDCGSGCADDRRHQCGYDIKEPTSKRGLRATERVV